jgi:hypothetical protein
LCGVGLLAVDPACEHSGSSHVMKDMSPSW